MLMTETCINTKTIDNLVVAVIDAKGILAVHNTLMLTANSGNYDIVIAPQYSYFPRTGFLRPDGLNPEQRSDYLSEFIGVFNNTLIIPGTMKHYSRVESKFGTKKGPCMTSVFAFSHGKTLYSHMVDNKRIDNVKSFNWQDRKILITAGCEIIDPVPLTISLNPDMMPEIGSYVNMGPVRIYS